MINHIKFIITFSALFFVVSLIIHDDFVLAIETFLGLLIWFIISSLIINFIKNMKKGHWITIIILSLVTLSSMMFSFVKDIESKRYLEIAEERRNRELEMRKVIEAQESKIDSLTFEIDKLKNQD